MHNKQHGWLCVVDSLFIAAPIVCGGFVFGHKCFVMQYLVPFLVLQSSAWLIYFHCGVIEAFIGHLSHNPCEILFYKLEVF